MTTSDGPQGQRTAEDRAAYRTLRDYVAKGALSMVDWANHKPENRGMKPKVGGHQASSLSSVDLLCALYLDQKRPQDRVAVKPHAAPVIYSLMHLMGLLDRGAMETLREFGGPQPYPTKCKNPLFVDYTTSSEALGVCATIYDAYGALVQTRGLSSAIGAPEVDARYWAHCGDGELTEGQIDESLYDAGRWGLDNLVWIVDLNRQSLDRVMDDSGQLARWAGAKFEGQGWEVMDLRWGSRAEALFAVEGGEALKRLLEGLPDALFHPLLMLDGATLRQALTGAVEHDSPSLSELLTHLKDGFAVSEEDSAAMASALADVTDGELQAGVSHLGGHDLDVLMDAYDKAAAFEGKPVVIVAHTVKGYETSAAAHPENHGMVLPSDEVAAWGADRGLPAGVPYPTVPVGTRAAEILRDRASQLFDVDAHAYLPPPREDFRAILEGVGYGKRTKGSSGEAFQSLNMALLRTDLAPYLHFGAPDVGQTTHLGPVIKATGVFAPRELPDTYAWLRRDRRLAFDWRPSATGQFHALGIAEGNAMLWAYAFGRQKKKVEGRVPLLPVVTVYDKFFERAFNQLDYAAYSDGRFVAVGVPSGTGLSRETATHQSIQTMRMLMDLPGIIAYEPAFGADVHAIYLHALGMLWEESGEASYLRLSTQPIDQLVELPDDHGSSAIQGAYWLVGEDVRPAATGQASVQLVASGRMVAGARKAAAILAEQHDVGSRILNVTSYEALWRDWDAYAHDPEAWEDPERSYVLHDLFADQDVNAPLILIGDHVPSVAEWLPGALQRMRGARFLGPRRNGETGDIESIDRLHGMSVEHIVQAALDEVSWRQREGV